MSDVLRFDLAKDPKGNPIVYGRVGDSNGLIRKVKVFDDGKPFDLTGWTTTFEGNASKYKTKVFDSEGITVDDPTKGEFSYVFPNMAFAVEGQYERAYFSFTKNGIRRSSGDFEIIVFGNADINAAEAETIITEYNKLIAELRDLQDQAIDDMNQNFVDTQAKIAALEKQLAETQTGIEQALIDFENGNFWTKEESFNKEESSTNVINQVIGKEKIQLTLSIDLSERNSASFAGENTLIVPSSFIADANADYAKLGQLDNNIQKFSVNVNGQMAQAGVKFNIIKEFENQFGNDLWNAVHCTTVVEKVDFIRSLIKTVSPVCYGYGKGAGGNNLTFEVWLHSLNIYDGDGDGEHINTTSEVKKLSWTSEGAWGKDYVDDQGNINVIAYANSASSSVTSEVNIDYFSVEILLDVSANQLINSMIASNHVENLATQAEAELAEDNTKTMTPLRTDQYFKAHLATQEEAENGVSHLKTMTPKRTAEQTLARFGQSFTPSTKFIAHRGNNSFYPENSIAAFEKTSRHWGAETDIQLSTDGKWYCFHDSTIDRMTNGTGNFMDKTSIEIEALRLDTGNGINTLSDVEKKIPTFEQYLNACIKARIVPVIEITPLKTDFTDAQLDSIVTVIRRKGLLNKCVIICFNYEVLVKMRQRMPYTVMHWLISEYSDEMIQKCVINNFVPSFDYSKASVNQALIDKIHDAGLECGLWIVPYSDHQKYTDMGVDNITTDSASGNLRYFEPALRSGMTANKTDLTGPTYIEEMSNGEIHIRVNVTGGQNDVGVYICALESWAIPRHSLTLIGYVRSTKVTGFSFVPVAVGVGGYSANDSTIADANIKFGYLTTGTNWEQRDTYAAFDIFYRI